MLSRTRHFDRLLPKRQVSRGLFDLGRPLVLVTPTSMSGLDDRARESSSEHSMNGYFKRELVDYLESHRDPRNSVMHVVGIPLLFLGAVLPFSAWTIHIFGFEISAAAIAVAPIMICWLVLDTGLGVGILVAAALLIAVATIISNHSSTLGMWSITCVLIVVGLAAQAVGHHLFEGRRPALLDHPPHMLFGPMFLMAKLFIALGFRHDLAVIIQSDPQQAQRDASFYPGERPGEAHPRS